MQKKEKSQHHYKKKQQTFCVPQQLLQDGYCVRLRAAVSSVSVSSCAVLTGTRPGFRSGRFRVRGPGNCSGDTRRPGHHLVVPRQRLGAKHGGRVVVMVGHTVVVQVVVMVQVMGRITHIRRGRATTGVVVVRGRLQGRRWRVVMRLTTHTMR
ncbi:hypothetical protein L798_00606 [Zootermopsis nevadensis]|uniref:Uncharacterized protein n=1 Tax=Zootermopsis nevadensis TaxID=136037 RepID=A0A067RSG0_ZOONE|nr:hypothetical protein L798_00606 [Zootermopsis nevadensis]